MNKWTLAALTLTLAALACQLPAGQITQTPYPTVTSTPAPVLDSVTASRALYVRSDAGIHGRIVGVIYNGDVVEVLGKCDSIGWIQVKSGDLAGFVNADYLEKGCE